MKIFLIFIPIFLILSLIIIIIFSVNNLIYSLLLLIVAYLIISIYFIFIGLDFIGFTTIIVYIGAIAMLFLFVLMLFNPMSYFKQLKFFNLFDLFIISLTCFIFYYYLIIKNNYFFGFLNFLILFKTEGLVNIANFLYNEQNYFIVIFIGLLLFLILISAIHLTLVKYIKIKIKYKN